MPMSRAMKNVLELAKTTPLEDDAALDRLGRAALAAVIEHPETPDELRRKIADRLQDSDHPHPPRCRLK